MTRPGQRAMARLLPDDAPGRAVALEVLRGGGIVAMPTDTVYGVGVALDAPDGLARLFAAKERPLDRAIVLLVAHMEQAASVGVISPVARLLAERFWPGGLTLVLAQAPGAVLPAALTGGAGTIGVRVPDHDCPRELARALGPLPVTSANLSGQPEARDAAGVLEQLGERIELVLDGGLARGGTPSTVVDCSGELPRVLREGAIEAGRLVEALETAFMGDRGSRDVAKSRAVRAVGVEAAVAAAKRLAERVAVGGDYESPDFWAFLLGAEFGRGDPELGWDFLCRVTEAVSDERALSLIGASQLKDFCWVAGPAFIDRIEERARTHPRFRAALSEVWPGRGTIPAEIYARIRRASGRGETQPDDARPGLDI